MAVLDGDEIIYVAQAPSRHSMRMFTEVGRRVLPHCTAVGKALLAHQPPDTVRALLTRTGMPAHTPHTITDPDTLLTQLAEIRTQGYALDEGEQELGVRCVAVALPGNTTRAAISVSGPETRLADLADRVVPLLHTVAASLATDLNATDSTH